MGKEERTLECPVCGRLPKWELWEAPGCVTLYSLVCKSWDHILSTSYWREKSQAIYQWNHICNNQTKIMAE